MMTGTTQSKLQVSLGDKMPVNVWVLEEYLANKEWWVVAKMDNKLIGANTKENITLVMDYCRIQNPSVQYRMRQVGGPAHISNDQLF
jgi:hypothetical protein